MDGESGSGKFLKCISEQVRVSPEEAAENLRLFQRAELQRQLDEEEERFDTLCAQDDAAAELEWELRDGR